MATETILGLSVGLFVFVIIFITIWEVVWKGIALWYSARRKQKAWFVILLIFNTIGILPIVYLLIHRNKKVKKKKRK